MEMKVALSHHPLIKTTSLTPTRKCIIILLDLMPEVQDVKGGQTDCTATVTNPTSQPEQTTSSDDQVPQPVSSTTNLTRQQLPSWAAGTPMALFNATLQPRAAPTHDADKVLRLSTNPLNTARGFRSQLRHGTMARLTPRNGSTMKLWTEVLACYS